MTHALILTLLATLFFAFVAALYYLAPGGSRGGFFFAVTVPADYRRSPNAVRTLRNFRIAVIVHALIGMVLAAVGLRLRVPLAISLALIWQLAGTLVALAKARKATLPYSLPVSPVREASLAARRPEVGDAWWVQVIPFIPLVVTSLVLLLLWQKLPVRIPAHWNLSGQPNRWVGKFPRTVFACVIVGFVMCGMLGLLSYAIRHWSRQAYVAKTETPGMDQRSAVVRIVLIAQCLVATIFSVLGTLPLLESRASARVITFLPWVNFAFGLLVLGWCLALVRRSQSLPASASLLGDMTPDHCWKAGIFYLNPDDPALLVEKRFGVGYTLNFARPAAWMLMAAVLVLPMLLSLLLLHRK